MEQYRIKTSLKKIGGSYYALVPTGLHEELGLSGETEILAHFEKFRNIIKEACIKCQESSKMVELTLQDESLIGVICEVLDKRITFQSDGKFYMIPYEQIKEIKEVK